MRMIRPTLDEFAAACFENSSVHGFYDSPANQVPIAKHMLMVTEIAEMTEAVRKPSPAHHIDDSFTQEEEEAADIFIRLMDYCGWRKLRITEAVEAKMEFNKTRPYRHGKTA